MTTFDPDKPPPGSMEEALCNMGDAWREFFMAFCLALGVDIAVHKLNALIVWVSCKVFIAKAKGRDDE